MLRARPGTRPRTRSRRCSSPRSWSSRRCGWRRQSIDVLMDRTEVEAERAHPRRARQAARARSSCAACASARRRAATSSTSWSGVPLDTGVRQAHAVADDIEEVGGARAAGRGRRRARRADASRRATCASAPPPRRSSVPEVREVHNVRVMHLPDGYELSLHVKLPRELSLTEAHGAVERLEDAIRDAVPELRNVHTHIEPLVAHRLGAHAARATTPRAERDGDREVVRRCTGAPTRVAVVPRRRAGPGRARHDQAAGRAAAALRPPARGRDRGGRARALPRRSPT